MENVQIHFIIIIVIICINFAITVPVNRHPTLLVISYDAFRNEYLSRNITSYMNKFRQDGTYAEYMRNVFPTKTFPNHHSIATGLFPGIHGVMANSLFDHQLNKTLAYSYELFHYNEDILPIWTLNEKAGEGRHSGCMMWPGSNFAYNGTYCTFTEPYNKTESWQDRVETVITWLKHPRTPANLVMMYFEDPDMHGHIYGPESDVIQDLVIRLDNLTKYIQTRLNENNLNHVNVIHVSDHGMDSVSSPKFIDLTQFTGNGTCDFYGTSPILQIVPKPGKMNEVFNALQNGAKHNGHFKVYKHDTLLERWHFYNEAREGPITAVADIDWGFQDMWRAADYYKNKYNVTPSVSRDYGIHGYDNNILSMYPYFMAKGPAIKEHTKVQPFDTVDLYHLFCEIIHLTPPAINGTAEHIRGILKSSMNAGNRPVSKMMVILGSALVSFSIIAIICGFVFYLIRRRQMRQIELQSTKNEINQTQTNIPEAAQLLKMSTSSSDADL